MASLRTARYDAAVVGPLARRLVTISKIPSAMRRKETSSENVKFPNFEDALTRTQVQDSGVVVSTAQPSCNSINFESSMLVGKLA